LGQTDRGAPLPSGSAAARLNGRGVKDGGEVGGNEPSAAMGLIGDDQIQGRHPPDPKRLGDLGRRLLSISIKSRTSDTLSKG
jgi:hypothetical protein